MTPVFQHGQLRLYLLALLDQGPRHGYDIIRDLEERFGGLYTPSAGTVYPRLAKLEEDGLVSRTDDGRKATYVITDAGRQEVRDRKEDLGELQADLDRSARELADEVRARVHGSATDLRAELKAAAREARRTATTVPGASGPGSTSWQAFSEVGPEVAAIERSLRDLSKAVRKAATGKHSTPQLRHTLLGALEEAQRQVRDAARQAGS
ncbi:DNA-binding PadR family transcriptional regulator [Branchiibius hedensis]|uniref:DNA-binding transcriptional regulator, PadR family n=1 Tax=Branchiibius hedensis TaxID=672460 RepID=A0A2Y8ZME6_9MICO|nr:PadR family transcriptional regulator [Branchiibius hedensis]PWJ24643.1 DNA-binding PadR family transcriptional regulator [Branchiibius hedensis]SSA33460.1 DNA-binding transcriptional regulator, PadR family [Branchiibius hedensis]